jgi:hypothetical protein
MTMSSPSRLVSLSIVGEQLLAHCALMTDRSLDADFIDTVLPEAPEADRDALHEYYLMRRRHPSFSPGQPTANNHGAVEKVWRAKITTPIRPADRRCEVCDRPLSGHADRRTCGQRCRKTLSRRSEL